jgi:hypothetical protein
MPPYMSPVGVREALMSPRGIFAAVVCAALLAAGFARADEYRPEEFFSLDLPKAVFSPKRLGPPARFEQVQVQAKTDFQSKPVHTMPIHVAAMPKTAAKIRPAHVRAEKPRRPARTRLARRHGNPLDAQASDTRIQVWPCRSGGICNWQRATP